MKHFALAASALALAAVPGLAQESAAPEAEQPADAPATQTQPALQQAQPVPQQAQPAPRTQTPPPSADAPSANHASQPASMSMDTGQVTGVDVAWLSDFAEGIGHTILQAADNNGEAVVLAEAEGGLKYGLIGKACMAEGAADCKGLQIMAIFTPMGSPTMEEINTLNYDRAAVSVWMVPPQEGVPPEVGVNRYLILDHGQTEDNIALNVSVFVEAAQYVRETLEK